jgi:DNA recombination protein RmuC
VGFVENLNRVGVKIEEANLAFNSAKGQLTTGAGNLVQQATELKNLGLKTKKVLPQDIEQSISSSELKE